MYSSRIENKSVLKCYIPTLHKLHDNLQRFQIPYKMIIIKI